MWVSWFYCRMIHVTQTFTQVDGIQKLTGQVAKCFGIENKGILSKGTFTDVVVFNQLCLGEKGTTF